MSILFIGKRFYTNRDAYMEKFGRIYQLPYYWSQIQPTELWLIDYHSKEKIKDKNHNLNIISTPIFSTLFFLKLIKTCFKKHKTIIASGDCYIGLLSFILAKLTFSKFIFDVYDKYNTFSGYRNIFGINIYQFLLKRSDICLFASQKLLQDSEYICKEAILVPNGIDEDHFYPRDKIISRKKFSLSKNDLYIGYFGSMEVERGLDDLIEAVKIIRNDGVDLKILIGGAKRKDLDLDLDFIFYLGNIPFKQVPIAMACCDLLALPYRSSIFLDNAASCKIMEYYCMQSYVISTETTNLIKNFNPLPNHWYITPRKNPILFASSIKKALDEKNKIIINQAFISQFTWKNIAKIINL